MKNSESAVALAAQALNRGERALAESLAREALASAPRDVTALTILGIALQMDKRYAEAETVFHSLTGLQPAEPAHWSNLGLARRGLKQLDAALAAHAHAASLGANGADFDFNVALVHLERGDLEAALSLLKRAVNERPDDAEIRVRYAHVCYDSLHAEDASIALRDWPSLRGLTDELVAEIAQLLTNLGEPRHAEAALARIIGNERVAPLAALTAVQVLERTNRVSDARALFDRTLADPRLDAQSPERLASEAALLQREGKHETAMQLLTRALPGKDEFPLRHFGLFPIARSLDALGRFEDAYRVLLEAHESQAEYLRRTRPALTLRGHPTMSVTRFGAAAADVAQWNTQDAPTTAESPVFVVAFPRSGTTLLELALDAHPALVSMDEQPFVQNALEDMIAAGAQYPEQLAGLSNAQLAGIRANYWDRVARKVTIGPGRRLVDKNPLNILRLPAMRRLFPAAPILLAIRHPCDVVLSCFMQHFRAPDFALLCHDLPSLAHGFTRTFDYWYSQSDLLQPTVREVRYEEFVSDFEPQMQAIIEFLGLPWDPAVLAPAERARAKGYVSTPSYAQVTEPVHRKSIARWRSYERHFGEVMPILAPYLARWNYDNYVPGTTGASPGNSK